MKKKSKLTKTPFFPLETHFYLKVMITFILLFAIITTYLSFKKHINQFAFAAIDSGIFQNVLYNLLNFNGPYSNLLFSGTPNFFQEHSFYILLPILPYYALSLLLFGGHSTLNALFFLQNLFVYLAIIPVFLIAYHQLKNLAVSTLLAGLVLFSPLLYMNTQTEFHPETFLLFFAFMAFYFFLQKNFRGYIICIILSLSCTEQFSLHLFLWGWMIFFFYKSYEKKYTIATLAISLSWFLWHFFLIKFLFSHNQDNIISIHFKNLPLGEYTSTNLIFYILTNPIDVLSIILSPQRIFYTLSFISVLIPFAFFSLRSLIILPPVFLYFVMADDMFLHDLHSYYLNMLFFSGVLGLIFFFKKINFTANKMILVLTTLLIINQFFMVKKGADSLLRLYLNPESEREKIAHEMMKKIPSDTMVMAPFKYFVYLANRQNIIRENFDHNIDKSGDFNAALEKKIKSSVVFDNQNLDYIFMDLVNPYPSGFNPYNHQSAKKESIENRQKNVEALLTSGQWSVIDNREGLILLKRK